MGELNIEYDTWDDNFCSDVVVITYEDYVSDEESFFQSIVIPYSMIELLKEYLDEL